MKRDRYHAELTRQPPETLADTICKLREENAALRFINNATLLHRQILPEAYIKAITHLYWIAHDPPRNPSETPSRPVPASRPPARNPEAMRIWKEETAKRNGSAAFLARAAEEAVRNPHGTRPSNRQREPRNHAA